MSCSFVEYFNNMKKDKTTAGTIEILLVCLRFKINAITYSTGCSSQSDIYTRTDASKSVRIIMKSELNDPFLHV